VEQGASDNGIDIDQMKVVGIIWQSQQPMAVLEHNKESGVSFTIKEGDPVHNGRVARISRDAVTFDISEYGIARSYSLKLVSSKEGARK
jgi:Tfp pilus assembly protein PilP